MGVTGYVELLRAIETHLAAFGDKRWPPRLAQWVREFESAQRDAAARVAHYERTRRALGGMGSIADVVIAPEAEHMIANDEKVITDANDKLLQLVQRLDKEIEQLLANEKA